MSLQLAISILWETNNTEILNLRRLATFTRLEILEFPFDIETFFLKNLHYTKRGKTSIFIFYIDDTFFLYTNGRKPNVNMN